MKATTIIISTIITFFFSLTTNAQLIWQKSYGGSCADGATSIKQTNDLGYILTGNTSSNDGDVSDNHGGSDIWTLKIDPTGNILWKKCIGGSYFDGANSIQQTNDHGYIIAGYTLSNDGDVTVNHGEEDVWIIKLDTSGNIQWQKTFGGDTTDYALSIQQTNDSGYIVAGSAMSTNGDVAGNHGDFDCWILKLSSAGSIQWQKCLGGSNLDGASSVQQTTDGGYIVAGATKSNDGDVSGNHGSLDYWILKLSSTGNMLWQKCYGGSSNDIARSVQQTIDGGYIAAGVSESYDGDVTGNHGDDYWVIKLDSVGNLQWQKCLGGSNTEDATCVLQTSDGEYIVAGRAYSNDGDVSGNFGQGDFWIVKITSSGNIHWQQNYGGSQNEILYSIQQTSDGGYITAGETASNNGDVTNSIGGLAYWVAKLGSATAIDEQIKIDEIAMYPNPVINNITMETDQKSEIEISNIEGQLIKTITTTDNKTIINVSEFTSGVYILEVKTERRIAVKKFIKE